MRDAVAEWLRGLGRAPSLEHEVPHWNHRGRDGSEDAKAILDVVYRDPTMGPQYIDVSVVDSAGMSVTEPRPRNAIARRERVKQRRYPGEGLVPFVLDTRGRWGEQATTWLLSASRHLDPVERTEAIGRARTMISRALQQGVAEQILAGTTERKAPQGVARNVRHRPG